MRKPRNVAFCMTGDESSHCAIKEYARIKDFTFPSLRPKAIDCIFNIFYINIRSRSLAVPGRHGSLLLNKGNSDRHSNSDNASAKPKTYTKANVQESIFYSSAQIVSSGASWTLLGPPGVS